MRLSEAIRLGSMLGPQADGEFYRDGATCAQGAALLAVGAIEARNQTDSEVNASHEAMIRLWPWADDDFVVCPVPTCEYATDVRGMIAHLNNSGWSRVKHQWTREQIADWVSTIEPPESSPESERTTNEDSAEILSVRT